MPTGAAMSFTAPNYSGILYNKSNTSTPFFDSLGPRIYTNHVEFVTNSDYENFSPSQPAISESASMSAPTPTFITRSQAKNVTQIFHESVSVSYAKMSNMGTMSGLNIAMDAANVANELDWQIARRMEKIKQDIEYTFLRGEYNLATKDTEANKTRGILEAITTNTVEVPGPLNKAALDSLLKKMYDNNAVFRDIQIFGSAASIIALGNLYTLLPGYQLPADRRIGGMAIDSIVTHYGTFPLRMSRTMPDNIILVVDMALCRPVEQITPGKGNFFYEELSRTGAGIQGQIFGQIGLDYGAEWQHGKLTLTEEEEGGDDDPDPGDDDDEGEGEGEGGEGEGGENPEEP